MLALSLTSTNFTNIIMSESLNTKNETVANQYAAGQHSLSANAPTSPLSTTILAQTETPHATSAPFRARGQRVEARSAQQHHAETQPMAIVENGREVEGERDPSNASEWEKLVANAALILIGEELEDSQERNARVNRSTNEDIEAAGYLLNLPLRAKVIKEEEVILARKKGWQRE